MMNLELTAPLVLGALMIILAAQGCENIKEARGEPDHQVINTRWSKTSVTVYREWPPGRSRGINILPGHRSPKREKFAGYCILSAYGASVNTRSDENPYGFPPDQVNGGECVRLADDHAVSITITK